MKHTFFAPPESISETLITLPEEEAHHATRVLRVQSGDEVAVVDGEGHWYRVSLEILGRKSVVGQILECRQDEGEEKYRVFLCVGMLKNLNRFEMVLEKATELGVASVTPLITKRSEKARFKPKRAETIVRSAMKQAGRSRLMRVEEPVRFKKWIKQDPPDESELRIVCHESAGPDDHIDAILASDGYGHDVRILIGPEGGFAEEEIEQLKQIGFLVASLGSRRLRTETAAIISVGSVMLSNYGEGNA